MLAVRTSDLSHSFHGQAPSLERINLQVDAGTIYGFLGPNGAGKTTTLRLVLGLLKKQYGAISIFEKEFEKNRIESLKRIGSLIESPSVYAHLTAIENLKIYQNLYACPASQINEALTLVGLANTGKKKAGKFSLGMKQRLSLAIAIMHRPALLILDEPTNGLDPNGILEMRNLLKQLNQDRGITILISSHLLAEIDRLVTHVGIINNGKMMFQGTLDALKEKQQQSLSVVLRTRNKEEALLVLRAMNIQVTTDDEKIILPAMGQERISEVNRLLVTAGVGVYELSTVKNDLESIFMDIVSNDQV